VLILIDRLIVGPPVRAAPRRYNQHGSMKWTSDLRFASSAGQLSEWCFFFLRSRPSRCRTSLASSVGSGDARTLAVILNMALITSSLQAALNAR